MKRDLDKEMRDHLAKRFYQDGHGECDQPDDPETSGPFVIGNWYKTDGGRWVKMVAIANKGKRYETVIDHLGHNRYSKPGQGYLCGRCTGTSNRSPDNIDIIGEIRDFVAANPDID